MGWVCLDSPSAVGWGVPPPRGVYLVPWSVRLSRLATLASRVSLCGLVPTPSSSRQLASPMPSMATVLATWFIVCFEPPHLRLPSEGRGSATCLCFAGSKYPSSLRFLSGSFLPRKGYNSAFSFRASLLAWSDGMLLGVGGLHCSRFVCFASLQYSTVES